MTDHPPDPLDGAHGDAVEERAQASGSSDARRRRRADVFGDVLPERSSDERDGWGERAEEGRRGDQWLRRQVPPHHE